MHGIPAQGQLIQTILKPLGEVLAEVGPEPTQDDRININDIDGRCNDRDHCIHTPIYGIDGLGIILLPTPIQLVHGL